MVAGGAGMAVAAVSADAVAGGAAETCDAVGAPLPLPLVAVGMPAALARVKTPYPAWIVECVGEHVQLHHLPRERRRRLVAFALHLQQTPLAALDPTSIRTVLEQAAALADTPYTPAHEANRPASFSPVDHCTWQPAATNLAATAVWTPPAPDVLRGMLATLAAADRADAVQEGALKVLLAGVTNHDGTPKGVLLLGEQPLKLLLKQLLADVMQASGIASLAPTWQSARANASSLSRARAAAKFLKPSATPAEAIAGVLAAPGNVGSSGAAGLAAAVHSLVPIVDEDGVRIIDSDTEMEGGVVAPTGDSS
jgi:hypothetical protein